MLRFLLQGQTVSNDLGPLLSLIPNLCGHIESSVCLALRRATAAAMEKKSEFILNNDISDLEKTLNSIGVYGNERKKGQATVSAPSGTIDHNEFLQSSQYRKVEKESIRISLNPVETSWLNLKKGIKSVVARSRVLF